jgi:hypothetical protein
MTEFFKTNKALTLLIAIAVIGTAFYLLRLGKKTSDKKTQSAAIADKEQKIAAAEAEQNSLHWGKGTVLADGTYIPTDNGTYKSLASQA